MKIWVGCTGKICFDWRTCGQCDVVCRTCSLCFVKSVNIDFQAMSVFWLNANVGSLFMSLCVYVCVKVGLTFIHPKYTYTYKLCCCIQCVYHNMYVGIINGSCQIMISKYVQNVYGNNNWLIVEFCTYRCVVLYAQEVLNRADLWLPQLGPSPRYR